MGKDRGKRWGGSCGDALRRCVHDRKVVNTNVCGVFTVRPLFRLRAPSRNFTGSCSKVLPSRAASNLRPVNKAGP